MLTIEITNISDGNDRKSEESIGITCPSDYRYVVKVGRKQIASGKVLHDRRTHFSLLLAKIADDAKIREFERVR